MSPRLFYPSAVCLGLLLFLEKGPTHGIKASDPVSKQPFLGPPLELGAGALTPTDGVVFLSHNNTQILAHQGSSVTLSCRLTKPPNSGMVTWTRQLEHENSLQVLSIGDFIHISDSRFLIAKKPLDNDWQLKILAVSSYDSGQYLCQATTHPPQHISVRLIVVDAYAEIQVEDADKMRHPGQRGPKEMLIKSGSQIKLKCELKKATEKPEFIFWYHNLSMVNYSPRTGTVVTKYRNGWGSMLVINSASDSDGGNYTCSPHNIMPDSVIVTIMDREGKSAAVYKDTVISGGESEWKNKQLPLLVIFSMSLSEL